MNYLTVKEYIGHFFDKLGFKRGFQFFYNLGVDFYAKKDYERAVKNFKHALKQKNVKPQGYYNLGLAYQSMKNYDMAILSYNKFLELKNNDYDGLYNLALTYYLKENFDKAVELFEKCIEIKKDEDGVKSLILSYLSLNQFDKACNFAEEIFQTSDIKLYYTAAKVFENKNAFNREFTYIDKAIEMYTKIIENDPSFFDAYISISICYAKKGEWENSVISCSEALSVNPISYEANSQMGLVYYCCNQVKDAIKYYEIALKLKPIGDYKAYSNLGYAYEKSGEKTKAVKIFKQLINKFPQCPAKDEIKNHLRVLKG